MINNDYLVDTSYIDDSGSYCDFLPIKGEDRLGFKSFKDSKRAKQAWHLQNILFKHNLAPRIFSEICKIPYFYNPKLLTFWNPKNTVTHWGFITEKATMLDVQDQPFRKLQNLVNKIYSSTSMKFWDCHWTNIGYIKRGRRKLLVCIDTGTESFTPYCNAWGYEEPGPKCPYCDKYQCYCSVALTNEDYVQ